MEPDRTGETLRTRAVRIRSFIILYAKYGDGHVSSVLRLDGQTEPNSFRLLGPHYRLFDGRSTALSPVCFETFPHAVACVLAGRTLSAKQKRFDRRRLLGRAGIVTDSLANIDEVDAALCALTAQHFLAGTFKAYGDDAEGYIVVPSVLRYSAGPRDISFSQPASDF